MGLFCLSFHHIKTSYSNFLKVRFKRSGDFYGLTRNILKERVLLQTGTRVEIYGIAEDPGQTIDKITGLLSQRSGMDKEELQGFFKIYLGIDAAEHLFRLVCCIESRVLGETYIPWQAEDGVKAAKDYNALGRGLGITFQAVFRAMLRAREETEIQGTERPVENVLESLKENINDFHGKKALLYGAGLTGRRLARCLKDRGTIIRVLNRNEDIGGRTAAEVGGDVAEHSEKVRAIADADILICATLASHYRVSRDIIKDREKPLFVVDVSPFGNVDPDIGEMDTVILVDGGIRSAVEENIEIQKGAVTEVERIIKEELEGLKIP
jgi:glutamyl-tRNA reductase